MGFAYSSKDAVVVPDTNPPGWDIDWPFPTGPTDPPPVFPPGWPPAADEPINPADPTSPLVSDFAVAVTVADIKYGTASSVVAYCTESGGEAPELLSHRIAVAADCDISTDGITFYPILYFSISNYDGAKYGISELLYFDLLIGDTGADINVICSVATVDEDAGLEGENTGTVEQLLISVTALGTIEADPSTAVAVEMRVQDADNQDLDIADGETIRVSAAIGATLVQVSDDGITFADYIDIVVTNYSGAKYGFSQSLYFDVDNDDDGSTLSVSGDIVGYESVTGTGTGTLEGSDMAYARAAGSSLTKSGPQTVDGVSCVAGDRVFATDLGIYEVASGAWTQLKSLAQLATQPVAIAEGTVYGRRLLVVQKNGTVKRSFGDLDAAAASASKVESGGTVRTLDEVFLPETAQLSLKTGAKWSDGDNAATLKMEYNTSYWRAKGPLLD